MKSIHWTQRLSEEPEDELPMFDPDLAKTKERPTVVRNALERDGLRDSAEHRVLRNIARAYAGYYGPRKPN